MASLTLELSTPKLGALMSELQLLIQSAAQHPPDKLLCFDLLTKLLATIDNEPKVRYLLTPGAIKLLYIKENSRALGLKLFQ